MPMFASAPLLLISFLCQFLPPLIKVTLNRRLQSLHDCKNKEDDTQYRWVLKHSGDLISNAIWMDSLG